MTAVSSEKIDLLIYGPMRPILENGFSDQFVVHSAETRADLERLTPDTEAKLRGMAVTYHTVAANKESLARFPKLEIVASFGVGYDHVDAAYARDHNIMVTNGSSEANFLATWMLIEPGDEMVIMLPNYMQIWGVARGFGAEAKPFHLIEEKEHIPDSQYMLLLRKN